MARAGAHGARSQQKTDQQRRRQQRRSNCAAARRSAQRRSDWHDRRSRCNTNDNSRCGHQHKEIENNDSNAMPDRYKGSSARDVWFPPAIPYIIQQKQTAVQDQRVRNAHLNGATNTTVTNSNADYRQSTASVPRLRCTHCAEVAGMTEDLARAAVGAARRGQLHE